jgi:Flp pilus assembly protein TadG
MTRLLPKCPARGQSLAEFALILPIFLLLVIAVFDVGRYVVAQNALTNAAREGVRLAVVNQDQASIESQVQKFAFLTAPTIKKPIYLLAAPLTSDADLDDNPLCTAPLSTGCIAVVRISADVSPITPIVSSLIGKITLSAIAMQPVEFVCPNPAIPGFSTAASCPKQP